MSPLRMPQLNEIIVAGRLTSDPEVSETTNGTQRGYCRIAVNRSFQRNGEWDEETSFFNVVAWAGTAERLEKLKKGAPVVINGRLRSYDPGEDDEGNRRPTVVEITAQRIQHVSYDEDKTGSGGSTADEDAPF